jgi:hypothetical protein
LSAARKRENALNPAIPDAGFAGQTAKKAKKTVFFPEISLVELGRLW